MRRILAWSALFLAAVLAVRANATIGSFTVGPKDLPANPNGLVLTTIGTAVDTSTGAQFYWDEADSLWLSEVPWFFGKTSTVGTTGAISMLGTGANQLCDTTHTAPIGLAYAESTVLLGYRSYPMKRMDISALGAANCSTQIYRSAQDSVTANGPDLVSIVGWATPASGSDITMTRCKIFAGPAERWMVYIKPKSSGAVNPVSPMVYGYAFRFRRP